MTTTTQSYNSVKQLLSPGSTNSKTAKNSIETFILYLAPADTIKSHNLCPFASDGCKKACLYTAGRGKFSNVQESRINKAKYWAYNRKQFYIQLADELLKIHDKAIQSGKAIAVRLNGTSDIDHLDLLKRYSGIDFLDQFYSDLIFYDYTKNINAIKKYKGSRYHLTFSLSESNFLQALSVLSEGGNIAAVFANELPDSYMGYNVVDGDLSDLRFLDPSNTIVGLKAKGDAKKDKTGFVIQN
jgi:hypothetical protein